MLCPNPMIDISKLKLQVGDAINVTRDDIPGAIIRTCTGGRASHCAIVTSDCGTLMAAQMMSDGCDIVSLNEFLYGYDKIIVCGVKRIPGLTADQLTELNLIIIKMAASAPKYDWDGDISFLSPKMIRANQPELYCSAFCESAVNQICQTFSAWELVVGNPKYKEWFGFGAPKKVISPDDILTGVKSVLVMD